VKRFDENGSLQSPECGMPDSPERLIIEALRYDHDNSGNARRILDGLRAAGWQLTRARNGRLTETMRLFADETAPDHARSQIGTSPARAIDAGVGSMVAVRD
jgi:hypothetical protein